MEEYNDGISVIVADPSHEKYVDTIRFEAAASPAEPTNISPQR